MNRRGQGISINIVIIAAIALVVLIIAVLLVTRGGRSISEGTSSKNCFTLGGACSDTNGCKQGETEVKEGTPWCEQQSTGTLCCRYDFTK
jgi:hypothetical protein